MARHRLSAWSVLCAAVLVAGCGQAGEAETVEVPLPQRELAITLDGYPGPESVGIVMADQRGYFDDVDIDVWTRTPGSRTAPLDYVAGEEVELAISHQPQVMLAGVKGVPVAAFGSLVSEPTAALIWLEKSKIGGVEDLEGKTIAIVGLSFERDFLEVALGSAGLSLEDVKVVRADYDVLPALLGGRADAILGSWNIEGAELEARGAKPVITRLDDLGIPPYEEYVLVARSDRLEAEPGWIRRFMAAVARGTAAAIEDPEAAAKMLSRANVEPLSRVRARVEATLPLLSPNGGMDSERAEDLAAWMQEEGLIEGEPAVDELFSNDYLPEQP